jgi:hypothetical protein
LYHRLVPPGGGRKGGTWGMDEDDLGKFSGPQKNDVRNVKQLPVQCMDPQNYEEKRIKQL